jgi:choline-sulfatase
MSISSCEFYSLILIPAPDHLGCYGYHRNTSPNIDRIASQGVRFDNCYIPMRPACLPVLRLWSGRTGFHTGVINHGGVAADPFIQGAGRGFRDVYDATGWISTCSPAGLYTGDHQPVWRAPFGLVVVCRV